VRLEDWEDTHESKKENKLYKLLIGKTIAIRDDGRAFISKWRGLGAPLVRGTLEFSHEELYFRSGFCSRTLRLDENGALRAERTRYDRPNIQYNIQ